MAFDFAAGVGGPLWFRAALLELDGRDGPLSVVSLDRKPQAVKFVEPDILDRPGLSIGKDDGLSEQCELSVPERSQDRRRMEIHSRHGVPEVSQASD
jgi:hypothetical protein